MNCTDINTAAEIIEAFRACNNPGEQIELFECLATRSDPPVESFLQILAGVKLEVVVVLTIQAFGKITDADTKVRLKESDGLLTILSQYAQSGATDLIRWMAATTIDIVGFDFIQVSLHLTEEPRKIAEKILQSKVRRFADSNLVNSDDYDEFVRFWIYGALERLKLISLNCRYANGLPIDITCQIVMSCLDLKGIKDVNAALQRADSMGDRALAVDENEVFEGSSRSVAQKKLEEQVNPNELNILIENQLHSLQSNNLLTRKSAAQVISKLGTTFIEQLKQSQPTLAIAVFIFSQDWYQLQWVPSEKKNSSGLQELIQCYEFNSLSDNQLESVAQQVEILVNNLSRKKVKQDCQEWFNQALNELEKRQKIKQQNNHELAEKKQKFEERKQKSIALRNQIESTFNEIRSFEFQQYNNFFSSFRFTSLPNLTLESNENNYHQLFQQHDDNLIDQLRKIDNSWSSHWRSQIQPLETQKRSLESEESKLSQDLKIKEKEHTDNPMGWWFLCLVVWVIIGSLCKPLIDILSPLMILPVIILILISTVTLTNFLYNLNIKNLEYNLQQSNIRNEKKMTQIKELYEKQDLVSKLLRPLINR